MLITLFPTWEETLVEFLTKFRFNIGSPECKSLIKIPYLMSPFFCLLYTIHSENY